MSEMRKVTVAVPVQLLHAAQLRSGASASETVRKALHSFAYGPFYEQLRTLRGKVKFDDFDLDELRRDRELDQHGNVGGQD